MPAPKSSATLTDEMLSAADLKAVSRQSTTRTFPKNTIVVNEGEPLLLKDFECTLRKLAPDDAAYRHDDETIRTVNLNPGERPNGSSHCKALLLSSSACLNVVDGRLLLGRWQRVFLAELDGPRPRDISVLLIGEAAQ